MQEFDIIEKYFSPLSLSCAGAMALRDDAAILRIAPGEELIITKDIIIEGVHFVRGTPPGEVARKLLRVNLSDIAAKGGKPVGYLLGLMLPKNTGEAWVKAFAEGLKEDMASFGGALLGGDTTAHAGKLALSLTAVATIKKGKTITRARAKPGDDIYVSGTIGDGFLGLQCLKKKLSVSKKSQTWLAQRYMRPEPRLSLGLALTGIAHASVDISDGLVADLGHICKASGCGAEIYMENIPVSPAAREALKTRKYKPETLITGGDDYEILWAAPSSARPAIAKITHTRITRIGKITSGSTVKVLDENGKKIQLKSAGYRHF